MAKALKTLLRSAIYQAPQGELHATPARVRRWAEQFREMKAVGIKIPVGWGHQPDALPFDPRHMPRAQQQYHFSKYNAGYLGDMRSGIVPDVLDPKGKQIAELSAALDCPGVELEGDNLVHWVKLPDGRQVKAAIGEVSVAIRDWKDGTGKLWPDAIVHVALTPLPVAHGHGGFSPAPAAGCEAAEAGITLSLSSLLFTLSTESEGDMAEDKDTKKKDDAPTESGGGESKKDHFAEGMEFLKRKGISLPDDTTPENFWERVCIAGHALENAETAAEAETDLDDFDAEPEDEGAEYTDPSGSDMTTEEQRPVMMSLATCRDPLARTMISRQQDEHRADLRKRLDRLVKRGMKPEKAQKIRGQIDGYTLSLDPDSGEAQLNEVDFLLSTLEDVAPARHPLKGLKTAGVARRPDAGETDRDRQKRQEEAGDELASLAGAR